MPYEKWNKLILPSQEKKEIRYPIAEKNTLHLTVKVKLHYSRLCYKSVKYCYIAKFCSLDVQTAWYDLYAAESNDKLAQTT